MSKNTMGKNIKLSATRIGTYQRCKRKYWFQYHEKMPKLSNPAFKLGLACHEALELAGKIWLEKGSFNDADLEKIFTFYDEISIKEGIEEMDVHAWGKDMVKSRLPSFAVGNRILSLEAKFGFWNDPTNQDLETQYGVPLMGAMDKIVELDNDTVMIVDYKTSKTAPTPDQLKEDLQLSLYDLVASILYPQYDRIVLCLDMLKAEPVYSYRTLEQRESFDKFLLTVYNSMLKLEKKDAYESLNIFCPWCDYKDYCDKYQEACTKHEYEFLPTSKLTDDELVNEYSMIASTVKILDTRKRELGMIIMEKIKNAGANLKGEKKQIYIRQNARTNYDTKEVHKLVPSEDFATMVNLNKKAVDAYCSKYPKIKKEVIKSATTNYTTPFLASKKIDKIKKKKKEKNSNGKKKTK